MDALILIIFVLVYVGMALGRVPGLAIDRTGIALVGAVAILASGAMDVVDMGDAIDTATLLLLFGLMIISSQLQAAGVTSYVAAKISISKGSGSKLLLLTILAAGLLSAILANDIVVFAMTPILVQGFMSRNVDPKPYLLGVAAGANAGSAMTIIGNPQNILIAQVGALDFWQFLAVCALPGLVSMFVVWWVIKTIFRKELDAQPSDSDLVPELPDKWQTAKGVFAIVGLLALFATPLPREVSALLIAGLLLMSRKLSSRNMIGAVDWHLLVLFACLFVVTESFGRTDFAQSGITWAAANGLNPESLGFMAPLMLAGANSIGNVPLVMLVLSFWPFSEVGSMYGLALLSTLAGNLLLTGSLANIITAERAKEAGSELNFADFAKAGIPITLITMAMACVWLWALDWMPL